MKSIDYLKRFCAVALLALSAHAADPMSQKLAALQGEEFDAEYVKHVSKHHKDGIEMAKIVSHHSENAELRRLAQKLVESQQAELQELKGLKGQRGSKATSHGSSHSASQSRSSGTSSHASSSHQDPTSHEMGTSHRSGSLHGGSQGHAEMEEQHRKTMSKLESAQGAEFDRLFVAEMSKHHRQAIEMNQVATKQAGDDSVRQFAQKSASNQQQELQQLQSLQTGRR